MNPTQNLQRFDEHPAKGLGLWLPILWLSLASAAGQAAPVTSPRGGTHALGNRSQTALTPSVTAEARAAALQEQGKLAEAEALYRDALAIRKKSCGPENPNAAKSLYDLGLTQWQLGRRTEAEALLREALEMQKKLLGPRDPATTRTLQALTELLEEERKTREPGSILAMA